MKRFLAFLTCLIMMLLLTPAGLTESDEFTFQLERVIQDNEVYWARDITGIYIVLKSDGSARLTGIYHEEEEAPAYSWKPTQDKNSIIVEGESGSYSLTFSDDKSRLTLQTGEGRQLVFVLRGSSTEIKLQPEDIEKATIETTLLIGAPADICPVDISMRTGTAIHYRMEDGNCVLTFNTAYGPFLYVIDILTGQVVEKNEPDIDAVRAKEGFREPKTAEELWEVVENQLPFPISGALKNRRSTRPDGNIEFYIESVYGNYYYLLDVYTGEILDREEPDIDAVRAQENFQDPVGSEDALQIAEEACGLDGGQINSRKVKRDGDSFIVTFATAYGDFIYSIDAASGKIVDRSEPDMDAARAQEGFVEPMTHEEAMDLALELCPVSSTGISKRAGSKKADGSYIITLTTVYGDFIYYFDGNTRELLDKTEPEMNDSVKEPLTVPQCLSIATKEFPLDSSLITDRRVVQGKNNTVEITLATAEHGDFFYVIDTLTGEILDRDEPETGDAAGAQSEEDIMWEAISAATATLKGYDYSAQDMRVKNEEKDGDRIITITFNWRDTDYEFHYSVKERRIID